MRARLLVVAGVRDARRARVGDLDLGERGVEGGRRSHMPLAVEHSPYGDCAIHAFAGEPVVILHGGYGKASAAGSTQYAIDRWHPRVLVEPRHGRRRSRTDAKVGDIVLVTKTTIYDIYEAMGDADEAIADYASPVDTSRWPARLARARRSAAPIVSGDRDLVPAEVAKLRAKYRRERRRLGVGLDRVRRARRTTRALIILRERDRRRSTRRIRRRRPATSRRGRTQTRVAMATLLDLVSDALPDLVK